MSEEVDIKLADFSAGVGGGKTKNFLKNLSIFEVSLVDKPMNSEAQVVLFKRDSGESSMSDDAKVSAEEHEALKAQLATLEKKLGEVESAFAETNEKNVELQKKLDDAAPAEETPPSDEDVLKGLPDAIQKRFDSLTEELSKATTAADEATEIAKRLQDEKMEGVYIEKARGLSNIAQDPEQFGVLLKRVADNTATAEDILTLETTLKAANEAIEKNLLAPVNKDFGNKASGDAEQALQNAAEEIQKRDDVSFEVAYSQAMDENPDLYTAYLSERGQAN